MYDVYINFSKLSLDWNESEVEIYYQTIFIISLKTINKKRVKALRNVVLCLMLPNCLWWMYDRLLSLKPDLDEANDLMIGLSLYSLRQTFLPLSGFYRFQAFVSLVENMQKWNKIKERLRSLIKSLFVGMILIVPMYMPTG